MSRSSVAVTLTLSLLSCSTLAAAQTQPATPPAQDREALYQQGADLRRQQRDADALALYQRLYQESREPRALAQIALAEGSLSRWIDADSHLTEALAASSDPWVMRNRAALDQAMANVRAHLGTLRVDCPTAGAEVWVEGHRLGPADGSALRVNAGTVMFEVRAAGSTSVSRVATVAPNGSARERVTLASAAAATGGQNPASPATDPHGTAVAPSGGGLRTLGLAGVIGGGALAVGGVIALVLAHGEASAYNDDRSCPGTDAAMQPPACASRISTGQTLEAVGWVGIGLGAAVGITGAVLLGTSPRAANRERAGWQCGPWTSGAGLACAGRF